MHGLRPKHPGPRPTLLPYTRVHLITITVLLAAYYLGALPDTVLPWPRDLVDWVRQFCWGAAAATAVLALLRGVRANREWRDRRDRYMIEAPLWSQQHPDRHTVD